MQTTRLFPASILLVVGALIVVPGCGDDDNGDSTASTMSGVGGGGGDGGGGDGGSNEGGNNEGGSGEGGGGGSGEGGGAPEASCETYCAAVMANCTEANAQYANAASCAAFCAHLPEGTAGEQAGNSLACRAYHAGEAAAAPATHCIHAGPGGGGVCGEPAESFCLVAPLACDDVYEDTEACTPIAAGFDDEDPYVVPAVTGDTLACRLYHLTEATANPEVHCAHIGETSPVCATQ